MRLRLAIALVALGLAPVFGPGPAAAAPEPVRHGPACPPAGCAPQPGSAPAAGAGFALAAAGAVWLGRRERGARPERFTRARR